MKERYGISRGIEEIAKKQCGISRGDQEKNHVEFAGVLVLGLKGCVCFIFASLFLYLNDSTCQTRKDVFYFT